MRPTMYLAKEERERLNFEWLFQKRIARAGTLK